MKMSNAVKRENRKCRKQKNAYKTRHFNAAFKILSIHSQIDVRFKNLVIDFFTGNCNIRGEIRCLSILMKDYTTRSSVKLVK